MTSHIAFHGGVNGILILIQVDDEAVERPGRTAFQSGARRRGGEAEAEAEAGDRSRCG